MLERQQRIGHRNPGIADMQESGEIVDTGAMLKEMASGCSASINNLGASQFPPPTFSSLARIYIIDRVEGL
jgi:hypothetical protein